MNNFKLFLSIVYATSFITSPLQCMKPPRNILLTTQTLEEKETKMLQEQTFKNTQHCILASSKNVIFLPIVYLFYPYHQKDLTPTLSSLYNQKSMQESINSIASLLIHTFTINRDFTYFTIIQQNTPILIAENLEIEDTENFIQNFNTNHNFQSRNLSNPSFIKNLHIGQQDEIIFSLSNGPAIYRNGIFYTGKNTVYQALEAFIEYFDAFPYEENITFIHNKESEIFMVKELAQKHNLTYNGFLINNLINHN